MTPDFRIAQGNTPKIADTLTDNAGVPADLTLCTVKFIFQCGVTSFSRVAAITNSPGSDGAVNYQMVAADSASPGLYQAQWEVTYPAIGGAAPVVRTFPTGSLGNDNQQGRYIWFEIVAALPLAASPSNIVQIAQMYEPVRVCLGDFNPNFRKYSDEAVASVVRTCLRIGKIPLQSVGSDGWSITPGIVLPADMALLMYHSAKMFMGPLAIETRIESRALGQKKGRPELFWFDLNNAIYDLENGEMFSCFQSFYAWVNSLTGIDIWSVLSDMRTTAPVATVSIGRAGVTVSTT